MKCNKPSSWAIGTIVIDNKFSPLNEYTPNIEVAHKVVEK